MVWVGRCLHPRRWRVAFVSVYISHRPCPCPPTVTFLRWCWMQSLFVAVFNNVHNRFSPGWVIHNLTNFCSSHVLLWPWPLAPWPWTFVLVRASCVQTLCKIWAKSNNPLQSYWPFSTIIAVNFWGGRVYTKSSHRCVDRTPSCVVTECCEFVVKNEWTRAISATTDYQK